MKTIVQWFASTITSESSDKNETPIVRSASFMLISPTSQSTRSMKWLKSHVPEDGSVFVSDVTSLYTALNVIGPKAKYLLSELSDENFNDFARMTCRVRGTCSSTLRGCVLNGVSSGNRCRFRQSYLCNAIDAHG